MVVMYVWIVTGFVIGVLVSVLGLTLGKRLLETFNDKAQLIQQYWLFVMVFSIVTSSLYLVVLRTYQDHAEDVALTVLNQATLLIFSIFVGYFAFAQVMDARKDKFVEKGMDAFRGQEYDEAIRYFGEAHAASPREYYALANLCEAYLVTEEFGKLGRKLRLLVRISNKARRITYYYLQAAMSLMKGYVNDARRDIKQTIDYVESDPDYAELYQWDFEEVQSSSTFMALSGDQKKMFENLIHYLERQLSPEDRARFVAGDYLLNPIPADQAKSS